MSMFLFLLQSALYLLRGTDATNYQNVYGEKLQSCSYDGMALTGFTRNGYCVDEIDDQGMFVFITILIILFITHHLTFSTRLK